MVHKKAALTTGDIAVHCGVDFRTVLRWIEKGYLKSFKLPGRGDNRVRVEDFLDFLRRNGIPIPGEFQPEGGSKRVLIVEDEADMARAMERVFRKAGFKTLVAPDGFRAGALLGTFLPSVMTLDLRLHGLGGLDVLRFVRETPRLSAMKILVVSAMPRKDLEGALKAGADDVLEKPFSNEELMTKVLRLLDGPQRRTGAGNVLQKGDKHA
jgi:CheY-like chemotaxis protein